MVPLSALALVAGIAAAVPYIIGFGPRAPRAVTAALLGVGLGGLSSSYAGWATPLVIAAAVVAGGALAALAVVVDTQRRRGLTR